MPHHRRYDARMTRPNNGGSSEDAGSGQAASGQGRALPPELNPRGAGRPRQPQRASTPPGGAPPGGTPPTARPQRSRKRIAAWIAGGLAAVLIIGTVTGWATLNHYLGNIK